jgi:hypothetical protein
VYPAKRLWFTQFIRLKLSSDLYSFPISQLEIADYELIEFCERWVPTMRGSESHQGFYANYANIIQGVGGAAQC